MAIHGTEHALENRITRLRSDQMAVAERMYDLEGQLKDVLARLAAAERELKISGITLGDDLDS
jgi:hypothetical protein